MHCRRRTANGSWPPIHATACTALHRAWHSLRQSREYLLGAHVTTVICTMPLTWSALVERQDARCSHVRSTRCARCCIAETRRLNASQ